MQRLNILAFRQRCITLHMHTLYPVHRLEPAGYSKGAGFTPGPSGYEDLVRSVVVYRLRELGLDPVVDELGNVVVNPSGGEPRLLAAAHMDELGFLITAPGMTACCPSESWAV
ncbi:hypothetical protein [Aeropyrum camini]|uniref:hypothetical protein n=1 Tax=Aeropyrum camini TaxID=229980 RepID=UPI0007868A21|nr:hypothetical protein [Aeropyrum camini]